MSNVLNQNNFADSRAGENVVAEHAHTIVCGQCEKIHFEVELSDNQEMHCVNCDNVLLDHNHAWLPTLAALSLTAFILFLASNVLPFLSLEFGGVKHSATLLDGVAALVQRDSWLLAGLVLATIFLFPLIEICLFVYFFIPLFFGKLLPGYARVLNWLRRAREWSMLEIFLLSVLVSAVKLGDMAILRLEVGAYFFFALVAVLIIAYLRMSFCEIWTSINNHNRFTLYKNEKTYTCNFCKAMVGESIIDRDHACPRCSSALHKRKPNSLQRTAAFVFAAAILYIPANILPIMTYTSLGVVKTNTIYTGVLKLIREGFFWIAAIVFIASMMVPIIKLLIMMYLLCSVYFKMRAGVKLRTWLYRSTEVIGRWSMVDVYVVTIFVALVQFGFFYTVEPEPAIVIFGVVVVLTMVAVDTFDPRLMWDVLDDSDSEPEPDSLEIQTKNTT